MMTPPPRSACHLTVFAGVSIVNFTLRDVNERILQEWHGWFSIFCVRVLPAAHGIALPVIEVSGVSESLDVVTKYSEEYLALEQRAQVEQCAAEVLPGRIL